MPGCMTAQSHNLNQCWYIINQTPRKISHWNFNWNQNKFIEENAFENVVCKTAAILFRLQCMWPVKGMSHTQEPLDGFPTDMSDRKPLWTAVKQNMTLYTARLEWFMMRSSYGNIFRVTGPLCREFTGHRWIPPTKVSDAELWCFLSIGTWINGWVNNHEAGDFRHQCTHYDITVMSCWIHFRKINNYIFAFFVISQHGDSTIRRNHSSNGKHRPVYLACAIPQLLMSWRCNSQEPWYRYPRILWFLHLKSSNALKSLSAVGLATKAT